MCAGRVRRRGASMAEQRCGDCKWYANHVIREPFGDCSAPAVLPDSCCRPERFLMRPNEGADCPTFERNEARNATNAP